MNSVFGAGERLQAGVFTIPNQPEELVYTEVSYLQPVGSSGTEAFFSISHSRIDAGSNLGLLNTRERVNSRPFARKPPDPAKPVRKPLAQWLP